MHAVDCLTILLALGAGQLDLHDRKERQPRGLVLEPDQPRVEVDLGREGGDADQRRGADDHERGDGLVEEAGVDVCCLFQDDDVTAGALGGLDLWRGVSWVDTGWNVGWVGFQG